MGRRSGRSTPQGSGSSAWNGAISWFLIRYARPSVLLPLHQHHHARLPFLGMLPHREVRRGTQGAALDKTLRSRQTARFVVQPSNRWLLTSDAEKPMEAGVWSLWPASTVAVPASCESRGSGMAKQLASHARSACCSIHGSSVPLRFSGVSGSDDVIDGCANHSSIPNGERCGKWSRALPGQILHPFFSLVRHVRMIVSMFLSGSHGTRGFPPHVR